MTRKEFGSVFKRFFITFLLCVPVFVVVGIFLTPKIGNAWSIVIYVFVGALSFVLEELWWSKHSKKMEEKRQENLKLRREKKLLKSQYEKMTEEKEKKNGK